jgi:molecular chaperone DnaJ
VPSSPHEILGVSPGATHEEIRRAWRQVARETHPDLAGEAGVPRFLEARAAYESLTGVASGRALVSQARPRPPEPPPWVAQAARRRAEMEAARRRAEMERVYWDQQRILEGAFEGYGYWTRAGTPRWRTR